MSVSNQVSIRLYFISVFFIYIYFFFQLKKLQIAPTCFDPLGHPQGAMFF